jgi:hypothetical protein
MNYYVIVSQNGNPANMTAYTSGNEQKNKNDAYALYHTELGYRHESRTRTEAIILDADYRQIEHDIYIKETE